MDSGGPSEGWDERRNESAPPPAFAPALYFSSLSWLSAHSLSLPCSFTQEILRLAIFIFA